MEIPQNYMEWKTAYKKTHQKYGRLLDSILEKSMECFSALPHNPAAASYEVLLFVESD